ncbi:protein mono-ADP-ribosyltransferase PARP14-like [Babylonia areolata]|uniref:protein mono-ADP-ribosyltransferase PARP14-like n=1 Tax=Babylonia areolata TaxID=304850 RepID=UPI003FD1570A
MSLQLDLVNICLVVDGFPPDFCPAEVARKVSVATNTPIEAIAPLPSDSVSTGARWLLRLPCSKDRSQCLLKSRAPLISDGTTYFQVKLDPPHLSLLSKPLEWITLTQHEEQRMDSVRTEDMYGGGGEDTEVPKQWSENTEVLKPWSAQGATGPWESPMMPPPTGPQTPRSMPQGRGPGVQRFAQSPPPHMEQGLSEQAYFYGGRCIPSFPPGSDLQRSDSSFSKVGVHPRSDISSDSPSPSSEMHPQQMPPQHQAQRQQHNMIPPMGHHQEMMPHAGMQKLNWPQQSGPYADAERYNSNPIYPAHFSPLQGGMPGQQQMANLKFGPPPQYPGQYYYQPKYAHMHTHDASEDHQLTGYQAGMDSSPQQPDIYLKVTELPEKISESELKDFFQDRQSSGGGTVTSISLDRATNSAAVVFRDVDDVGRVTQKAPLLLKGKKIQVQAASKDQEKAEIRTVEIRGLKSEEEAELWTNYFENPRQGGGDIESSQWKEAEKIFLITFEDASVAKAVASKGHSKGSMVLEVSLYTPPAEEEDCLQQTVLVRGFNPSKRDLYEMYFSNPRKGGDVIVDLRFSDDETAMYITFETPEVAQRIAGMTHNVGGRHLEVVMAPLEQPAPPSTIIVTECNLENAETYRFYFENPRRGGGEISDFVVDEEQKAILITFVESEVAQQVANKEHKVGKNRLNVAMYTPREKSPPKRQTFEEPKESKSEEEEEEEAAPKMVVLTVGQQQPLESRDTYMLYFESPRHGGGDGKVEDVDVDKEKRLVYVTFTDPAVAAQVASHQHMYNNQRWDVKLYVPPKPLPTYPNKLLFKNVADSTTRDCLSMFLERVTELEPQEILYSDEMGTVLVTFNGEPDLVNTMQMCQKRSLEQRKLTVSKVPISNCLLVENLNPVTTEDTIKFYFENKRSCGGPVEKLDLVLEERKCFIYFEDHNVVDRVLSKAAHMLDGSDLGVKRYVECLGQSGGSQDPTAFTLPQPVTMDTIDHYKVAFLRQSKTWQAAFLQQLSQNHGRGKFTGDSLVLECTLTTAVPKARVLAHTWARDVQDNVKNFISMLEVHRQDVMQQLWQEVEKVVSAAGISSPEGATLFTLAEESAFVVVGTKSMAKELFDKVSSTVKTAEEMIERRNQEVMETNGKLKSHQLRLLLAMGFHQEAEKRHEGLKVEIQLRKNCIVYHGLLKDVKEAQIEMYEILQPVTEDKMTKLSHMQKKLLESKEVKPHIVQKFKKQSIVAVWEMDAQSQLTVFAFTDKSLVDAIHTINKSVPEHVCELSLESAELLQSNTWNTLVQRLVSTHPGVLMITPDHNTQKVYITSIDSIMHPVVEEIEVFLQENSIYSQVVRFSPSRQLFIQQVWHQQLISMQNSLQAHKVQIVMKESGTELYVKGTSKGLVELRKKLEDLNSKIVCHEEKVTEQAKVKFIKSMQSDRDLRVLGQTNQCVVSLTPESADLEVVQSGGAGNEAASLQDTESIETSASVQLPSGVTIAAVKGDITQLPVDVIVNAANNQLEHLGGLARDIVRKGGKIIQEESNRAVKARGNQLQEGDIVMTGAGSLPCRAVVHAVGPVYRGGQSGEEDCLHDTIIKCMAAAVGAEHTSIAFPAISTGIFRYPVKEATRVIVEAVKDYLESHKKTRIKSVYFCHLTADCVQFFEDAIQLVFPSGRSTTTMKFKPSVARKPVPTVKGAASPAKGSAGHRVISVAIVEGEIAKQTTDVIINSTSNGLDLKNGAISASILKAAGQGLQTECRRTYPNGISTGQIARTSGHNLSCKEVYHLALVNYSNPSALQMLGSCMIQCLTEASRHHHKSISFPVLGTGNLGYPAQGVAETMFGAIDEFQRNTPSTSLRNANIVIYHADKKNLEVFKKVKNQFGGEVTASPPPPSSTPKGSRESRRFSAQIDAQPATPVQAPVQDGTSAVFEIGSLKLTIKQGNITEEAADAIVNSSNSQLDLSRGNVASALKAKCGEELIRECATKVSDIKQRGITHTKAYKMKSRVILHLNSERFSKDWGEAIKLCLQEAEQLGVMSLAMPALGTGAYGLSPSSSASALFHTLVDVLAKSQLQSLKEVRVVLFDLKMIPDFVSAVEELGNKHAKNNKGLFHWIASAMTGTTAPSVKQRYVATELKEVTLYIYAGSRNDIQRILRAFDDLVKEKFVKKEVRDDILLTLRPEEIEQIEQLVNKHKVEITVQIARGRVVVDGLQTNVFEAMQDISNILRLVERGRQELQSASMLANMVQWSYLEVTTKGVKAVEYEQKENHIIEIAYQNRKKNAEITDIDKNVFVIDFDSMMEYPKDNPSDTVGVLRQDKIKELASGSLPPHWESHGADEHVKLVALKAADSEYKTVEANLRKTLRDRTVTVSTIQRVQNRTLYQQYASKKNHLEKQNQGIENEKTLWHGTGPEAIENINNYGFNRSYCGKNATVYGEGVYFAVESHYSTHSTYSPSDPKDTSGKRYIYQCKVLVGHAVQGTRDLRVLPPREGSILYDSAIDKLTNARMYVIFNDTQAYPEYLITFT